MQIIKQEIKIHGAYSKCILRLLHSGYKGFCKLNHSKHCEHIVIHWHSWLLDEQTHTYRWHYSHKEMSHFIPLCNRSVAWISVTLDHTVSPLAGQSQPATLQPTATASNIRVYLKASLTELATLSKSKCLWSLDRPAPVCPKLPAVYW